MTEGTLGLDHHPKERAFSTALGHRPKTFSKTDFVDQIRGEVLWASGHFVFGDDFERGSILTRDGPG